MHGCERAQQDALPPGLHFGAVEPMQMRTRPGLQGMRPSCAAMRTHAAIPQGIHGLESRVLNRGNAI